MSEHRCRAWLPPVFLMFVILSASGSSELAIPDPGFEFSKDKIGHFLIFGLLATTLIRIPIFARARWRGAISVALLSIAYGGFDEWRQSFTPGRSVEFADWIADSLGAVVAIIAYRKCRPYRFLLELPAKRLLQKNLRKKARNLFRSFGP